MNSSRKVQKALHVPCQMNFTEVSFHNRRFHHPKKRHMCIHIKEKDAVREIRATLRIISKADRTINVAIFDLQKVMHVPKSNRGEIFYKRHLACFNFTVFNVGTGQGHCYFWHVGLAGRGANEIASCLHHYFVNNS